MPARHSLRSDLQFSTQTQQGRSFVVVKDPVTDRYFRFTETQAVILDLLRSPIDVKALAAAASERLGGALKPDSAAAFLRSLEEKLLLDTPTAWETLGSLAERRPRERNILYLRLVAVNAEKAFDWLMPKVRWCFTPAFHVFAAAAILSGIFIGGIHRERLSDQLVSLISIQGILLVWLVVLAVTAMHEFAHGLTCRHFGGKVREVGFMLIYFMPAFYCDVSDAWMFPRRRERLWVTFAGGYFQLVVWGAAAIVWRVAAEDTLISQLALGAILFAGIQTLFNFNPLIKLDGYYMLSDYLEIPNLRAKALRTLEARLAGQHDSRLQSNERRPLLVYGGLSLAFSTFLLSFVYVNIFVAATSYFAFAGLVGFLMFSSFTLKRSAAETVASGKALAVRAALKKYRNLGIAGAVLLAAFVIPWELRIAADFQILPRQEAVVRTETAGTVAEILVREGSRVEAGDVLARLYDFDKARALSSITGQLETKRAELALLKAGPRAEEIDRAQRLVETKETELANVRRNIQRRNQLEQTLERERAELRFAEIEFRRSRELFEAGLGARIDMELAQTAVEVQQQQVLGTESDIEILAESNDREADLKQRELAEARSALNLLMAGFRAEEIRQREAEAGMLEAQQRILEDELAKSKIHAPISGTVVTPFMERLANRHLAAGDELAHIVDLDRVTAELLVPEKEMAEVRPGSRVVLKARPYPSRDFEGRVDFIAPVAETVGSAGRFVRVRTELGNEDGALKPDMTGVAKIYAGSRPIIELMTRRIVRWIRTEFWDLLP